MSGNNVYVTARKYDQQEAA